MKYRNAILLTIRSQHMGFFREVRKAGNVIAGTVVGKAEESVAQSARRDKDHISSALHFRNAADAYARAGNNDQRFLAYKHYEQEVVKAERESGHNYYSDYSGYGSSQYSSSSSAPRQYPPSSRSGGRSCCC
jgi:hypothetical protein